MILCSRGFKSLDKREAKMLHALIVRLFISKKIPRVSFHYCMELEECRKHILFER